MSVDNNWRSAETEIANKRIIEKIIEEVTCQQILDGDVVIPEYDRKKGEVLFAIFSGGLAGGDTYLLTKDGAYSGRYFNRANVQLPISEKEELEICEQLRQVVLRHDPELGNKLPVFQPS